MDDAVKAREPWFRRYAQRGPGEAGLQLASLQARGLHSDGQRLMHSQGQPYGHLSFVRGTPLTPQELGVLLLCPAEAVVAGLEELLRLQVWRKGPEGVVFDPQLISMWEASANGKFYGSMGGNPTLKKPRGSKPPLTPPLTPPRKSRRVNLVVGGVNPDQIRSDQKRERRSDARAPETVPDPESGSEPAPPSVEEVIAFGQGPAGIPEAYCRTYHAKCSEGKRWVVRTAHGLALRDWQREVVRWQVADQGVGIAGKKNGGHESAEAIREALESETDPVKKQALLKALRSAE